MTISMFPNSTVLVGWCPGRRRLRRRRGSTIRLGNKAKRRGFCLGSRPVVQWGVMVGTTLDFAPLPGPTPLGYKNLQLQLEIMRLQRQNASSHHLTS
ncbi:hypothetical protein QQP08_002892 [Theobroma cacao]|nr:hypothetical protein QQP08_002892 [Theobroma cacao]